MAGNSVLVPGVTLVGLIVLALRLRAPHRRHWPHLLLEAVSVTLAAAAVGRLLHVGADTGAVLGSLGISVLFTTTAGLALSMLRVTVAVLPVPARQQVPFDAIVSFGVVSLVTAALAGVMLAVVEGGALVLLLVALAIVRAVAIPWDRATVLGRWSWGPRPDRGRGGGARTGWSVPHPPGQA